MTDDAMPTPEVLVEDRMTPEQARKAEAIRARDQFAALRRAGLARSEILRREDIATLGFAVVDLMLLDLVTGRLKPKSAKEAIEIARGAQDIARKEVGHPDATLIITTAEQRQRAIETLANLRDRIGERMALEAGPKIDPGVIDVEALDEPELVESVPQSAPRRPTLATLAATRSSTRTEEA